MDRLRRCFLIASMFAGVLLNPVSSNAQFSASYQTNVISGVTSNWIGDYIVGSTTSYNPFGDVLLIQNGGVFTISGFSPYGFVLASSNNTVLVTDPGSALNVVNDLTTVGFGGSGDTLVISNGAVMSSSIGFASQTGIEGPAASVIVTDPGSVWSNSIPLFFGNVGSGGSLIIRHGGLVLDNGGTQGGPVYLGGISSSSNNTIVVTDPGSVWTNALGRLVDIGRQGNNNSLVITNGGKAFDINAVVGSTATAYGNKAQVMGNGSSWINGNTLTIGALGSSNSLLVADGGQVFDTGGAVGTQPGSISNTVQVLNGGLWQNSSVSIGGGGSGNFLFIDGGTVLANNLVIGLASPTCDNVVQLKSGILAVTNNGTGVLEARDGELILNGGTLRVDTLVITNSCASFVHTSGTLIAGNLILDPDTFRIISVAREGNDLRVTWLMGPGATNTLQATTGGPDGSYATNGFTDIFIVTNNAIVGSITNYLDIGAATNTPSRFYRARLAP